MTQYVIQYIQNVMIMLHACYGTALSSLLHCARVIQVETNDTAMQCQYRPFMLAARGACLVGPKPQSPSFFASDARKGVITRMLHPF